MLDHENTTNNQLRRSQAQVCVEEKRVVHCSTVGCVRSCAKNTNEINPKARILYAVMRYRTYDHVQPITQFQNIKGL